MAIHVIARYATAGGGAVEVLRRSGLLRITTYEATCSGCRDGIAHQVNPNVVGGLGPEGAADRWARQHAAGCRRIPT
ncbi:hypothetical protein P3T35_003050 [Kitasatospora sp. GP30]|uniref:hypothetical protein n=1 Tax=Kitasatospora sp. GP30 TaxID=3035084 RepID=UPI000C6FFA31|nr:hypothetical protein [Kitasatospora sp. GP30]MDH6141037.1 hypothetical protein [Kitasatospora sp. GP30]